MTSRTKLIAAAAAFALVLPAAASAEMASGEVKKIIEDAGKITIKHGPIKSLDMGEMTMSFTAKDPAMLKSVKPGDKIKFEAVSVNGQLTVTKIEKAK